MTVADLVATTPNPYPDEEKALNAALAKAQGEFPQIHKSQAVDAGSYSYSYVDLATILAAVRPVLAKNGLALVQRLENLGGQPAIRTELRHKDGAVIAASFPIGDRPNNPQQLGSLLTYLRRYAVQAMLGIAAEDDDGQQASAVSPSPPAAEASQPRPDTGTGFVAPPPKQEPFVEDISPPQRNRIYGLKKKLIDAGHFDDKQFRAVLQKTYETDSVSGLTKAQATELITRLEAQETALKGGDASSA